MGNKSQKSISINKKRNNKMVIAEVTCPICGKFFDKSNAIKEVNDHLLLCGSNLLKDKLQCEIYTPDDDTILNKTILKNAKDYKLSKISLIEKSKTDIETKIKGLKNYIANKKISWEKGCCKIEINRNDLLKESIDIIDKVNLFKELKIIFQGEQGEDAGGLLREWFTICFKALESDQLKLFIVSESNEFSYNGKLLGKALLDNITINICFNKLIYKMILKEEITLDDLLFIDNPLYTSLHNLKDLEESGSNLNDIGIYYNIDIEDSNKQSHSFNLIENGINKPVTDIKDYINKRIFFMKGLYEPFLLLRR